MKVDGSRVSDELDQNASPVTKETCITDCSWFVSLSVFQISWAHARNAFEIKSATKAKNTVMLIPVAVMDCSPFRLMFIMK